MKNRIFIVIFIFILLASCAVFYIFSRISLNDAVAEITRDGEIIQTLNLSELDAPLEISVAAPDGGYNIIHAERDAIWISEADCPDKLCVKQGKITNGIYPIVCLPHRLVVQIVSGEHNKKPDIDAVVGR